MPRKKQNKPTDEPQFMDAKALLGNEIMDDLTNGKPITPEMAEAATGRPSAQLEKEQHVMTGLIAATLAASRTSQAIESMHREIITDSHLSNISVEDIQRYMNMLRDNSYRGAQILYVTVSAIFTKVLHDLEFPVSYDHITIIKQKGNIVSYHIDAEVSESRVAATKTYYGNWLAAAVCCYYVGFKDLNPELMEEIYAPAKAALREDDKEFLNKFVIITMAILTNTFSFLKLIDNTRLNDWVESSDLKADSDINTILTAAAEFFGSKED